MSCGIDTQAEEDRQSGTAQTYVMYSRYYALSSNHLMKLMEDAGYVSVTRLDDQFFQSVLMGTKAE